MDPNISIKQEQPEENGVLSFETSASLSYKTEVVDSKEFVFVSDIKLENGLIDDTLGDINNIPDDIRSVHMVSENDISTMPGKRKNTNASSLLHTTKKKKPLYCMICELDFVDISTFIGHSNAVHREDGINPIRSCPICDYDFTTLSEGDKVVHMWDHSGEVSQKVKLEYLDEKVEEHSCSLCSMSFRILADLISHMDMHKKVKQYFCVVCNLQFETDCELTEHIKLHRHIYAYGKDYEKEKVDPVKGKELPNGKDYEKEKVDPVKGKELPISTELSKINCTHRCPMCDFSFVEVSAFIIHWKVKHKVRICPICKKDYKSTNSEDVGFLAVHMQEHSKEEYKTFLQVKIPEIKLAGPSPKMIKSVNKKTTSNTRKSMKVEGEYLCPICEKSFAALTDMISHIDDHKQVKNFFCSACKLQFKTDVEFKKHKQTHEIEKLNMSCLGPELIRHHQNAPCGSRKYVTWTNSENACEETSIKCPVCLLYFIDKTTVFLHFQRVHICPICELCLSSKNDMGDHIKYHACQTCQIEKSVHQMKAIVNKQCQKMNCCIICKAQLKDNSDVCACNICNIRLPIFQYLKLHVTSHAEHYRYRICNLGNKEIIKELIKAPYCCLLCRIDFETNQLFMEHMNEMHCYHKKTNHYMCSICNIGFNKVIQLKKHNEGHLENINLYHNKNYICFICDKLFDTPIGLKTHNSKVHSICNAKKINKKMTCSICVEHFDNAHELNDHMRKHLSSKYNSK